MATGHRKRADRPVMKLDFVNAQANDTVDATAPQPRNFALAGQGAIEAFGMLIVNSRELVKDTLTNAAVFSSADLIEQGNVRPLIPLGIDPPDHLKYRKLLDPLFAPCFVLLTAGLDTVTDSLTCFWAFLAQHPEHRRRLVAQPELIPNAVEELLRWETPVPSVIRWAREGCPIGERVASPGQLVAVNLSAANLDPAEFPEPLEVRFDRPTNRHLAFGGGVHRCLGSHLARRELRVALREWHRRIPEYALSPGYEVRYRPPLRFVPDLQLSWPVKP
jgi:cytochrome P450